MLNIGYISAYTLVREERFKIVRIGTVIHISQKLFGRWLKKVEV